MYFDQYGLFRLNHQEHNGIFCNAPRKDAIMPIALLALTISAFAIGTTEFVIVGLLPTIAADLAVRLGC